MAASAPISKWLWFSGIALPVAFISFLNYLAELTPQYKAPNYQARQVQKPKTEFSFYQTLPQNNTRLVEAPAPANKAAPKSSKKIESDKKQQVAESAFSSQVKRQIGSRVLQVGSYKKWADADQKRAELTLLGLEASIEKADVGDNQVWYRVNLGPFSKDDDMEDAQHTLTLYDIPSLVRTQKN